MNWCPFGKAGEKSLVLVWKSNGVAALGIPGMIGAVTGWNKDKMALAMNACPGEEINDIQGMPAILYNRHVLESAKDIPSVNQLLQTSQPLSPYHMTIATSREGRCISFYQNNGENLTRDLQEDNEYLEVLNWEYPKCKGGSFNSQYRHDLLTEYFSGAKEIPDRHLKLMENALKIPPYINSWITMHSLIFLPGENLVRMSWGNGYAASKPSYEAEMTSFF